MPLVRPGSFCLCDIGGGGRFAVLELSRARAAKPRTPWRRRPLSCKRRATKGDRAEKIARLRAEAVSKLADIEANQKKGRPTTAVASRKAALHSRIKKLDRNIIPGAADEAAASSKKSAEQLAADARDNAPHHAAPTQLPLGGRPAAMRSVLGRCRAGRALRSPPCTPWGSSSLTSLNFHGS